MFFVLATVISWGKYLADTATETAPSNPTLIDDIKTWSAYLASAVEAGAALIIGIAAIEATLSALILFFKRNSQPDAKENIRLRLGRWLAVALEFGLAADILRTAIAPTWSEIGQLVVIAFLRTALNYFLQKEIDREAQREATGSTLKPFSVTDPPRNDHATP